MSLGVKQAGFRVMGAFDWAQVIDLSKTTSTKIRALTSIKTQEIDLVFGGPPCQGFSYGGLHKINDDRNMLIFDFIRLVRGLRPKYFVLENVQGLMSHRHTLMVEKLLNRIGKGSYKIASEI